MSEVFDNMLYRQVFHMKIKIFALTHKKFEVPQDKMYQPLQVGREEKEDLGYLCDNTGDNISAENCYYSELTGI